METKENKIPCAYCGKWYKKQEFPIHYYAKCEDCFAKAQQRPFSELKRLLGVTL